MVTWTLMGMPSTGMKLAAMRARSSFCPSEPRVSWREPGVPPAPESRQLAPLASQADPAAGFAKPPVCTAIDVLVAEVGQLAAQETPQNESKSSKRKSCLCMMRQMAVARQTEMSSRSSSNQSVNETNAESSCHSSDALISSHRSDRGEQRIRWQSTILSSHRRLSRLRSRESFDSTRSTDLRQTQCSVLALPQSSDTLKSKLAKRKTG